MLQFGRFVSRLILISSCHADVQFINGNLVGEQIGFPILSLSRPQHLFCSGTPAPDKALVRMAPSIPKENIMRRRLMVVLAGAALVGSLLATEAQARGGGGHGGGGVGHVGRFGGAHIGTRVGGIGGRYMAGISRGAAGYGTGTGYGTRIGYGAGIRYGTGILPGRLSGLAAAAFAQTATLNDSTGAYVPAPASGAVQQPPVGGSSGGTFSGPGLTTVDDDGVSTKTRGMAPAPSASAPSNTRNQAAPTFRSGSLVRLRSGGPLMTVKDVKGSQVDCFWTDVNDQINANSFPVDVLQPE
jgi:uncharacterized protein YodC (DUF2158 family)